MDRISKLAVPFVVGILLSIGVLLGARAGRGQDEAVEDLGPPPKFYGIVALDPGVCDGNSNGLVIFGNDQVSLNGGSVFSNGCLRASGTALDIVLTGGVFEYVADFVLSGAPSIVPWPVQAAQAIDLAMDDIAAARCAALPDHGEHSGNGTIEPGNYLTVTVGLGESLVMAPGLYCFHADFTITGGSTATGNDVTVYMAEGRLLIAESPTVQFRAPVEETGADSGFTGLLIVSASANGDLISLLGNPASIYSGTVYAPGGQIAVGSTSGSPTYATRLIGADVYMSVNTALAVDFPRLFRLDLANSAPAAITAGDPLTYTLAVSNTHNFAAVEHIVLTDTLPAGTSFISASAPYTLTGDTITWTRSWIGHGETWDVELVVGIPPDWSEGTVSNTDYSVTGDDAIITAGEPVTTSVELLPPMWVSSIDISVFSPAPNQLAAMATVTIVDAFGPVAGANVQGAFSGSSSSFAGGTTNASGQVTLTSLPVNTTWTGWTFCVADVTATSHWYHAASNEETCASINNVTSTPTTTIAPSHTPGPTASPSPTATPSQTATSTPTALATPTATADPPPDHKIYLPLVLKQTG